MCFIFSLIFLDVEKIVNALPLEQKEYWDGFNDTIKEKFLRKVQVSFAGDVDAVNPLLLFIHICLFLR